MKKLLFTLLGLAAALTLPAQDFKITHGPWLCDMTEDGVTVLWTTNKPALSWVEATEDDGRSFYAAEHTRHYETVAGRKQAHKTLHAVRLNMTLGLTSSSEKIVFTLFSRTNWAISAICCAFGSPSASMPAIAIPWQCLRT